MRRPSVVGIAISLTGLALLAGCTPDGGEPATVPSPGARRMAVRLSALADSADPMQDEQLSRARLRHFTQMEPPPDPAAMMLRQGLIAQEMLNAGLTEPALDLFFLIRQTLTEAGAEPVPGFIRTLDELAGIALFRRGRELACPESASTIGTASGEVRSFPCWQETPPHGAAELSDSARFALDSAIIRQETALTENPDDLRARWLLNLTVMGAGMWPDRVPLEYRIPASSLAGDGDLARFENVASEVGLDAVSLSGGGIVEDFSGDGLPDVMASSRGLRDQIRYFEADGRGRFVERTLEAGLDGLVGGLNIVQADYDNDGDPDVLVLRGGWLVQGYPNSLLRNDGGRFSDVTYEANLSSEHPTQTGAWTDFDGDGWLDLFIGNESRDGRTHPSELYRNRGDGTFEEVAADVGISVTAFVKGVTWGDYDDDGRPDLYVSILGAPNRLLRNLGPDETGGWSFEDVSEAAGVQEPIASFPTWFWDFDNDGHLDLFVSGYSAQTADIVLEYLGRPHGAALPRLYRNRGDGTFEDVTAARGLDRIMYAMGSNFGDLDNDGWLDLYVGTGDPDFRQLMPNRMFRNDRGRFEEVTGAGGFGALDKGHGVSFIDIDNDGDQDIHIVLGGANEGDLSPNALYENPGNDHRWISLTLEGTAANRAGIGARISVTVEGPDGPRTVHRSAGTGGSFGANPLRQEFGLGPGEGTADVVVRWPGSGTIDEIGGLTPNRAYRIREGSGRAEPIARPTVTLGGR